MVLFFYLLYLTSSREANSSKSFCSSPWSCSAPQDRSLSTGRTRGVTVGMTTNTSSLLNNHYIFPELSEDVLSRWVMVGDEVVIPSGYGQVLGWGEEQWVLHVLGLGSSAQ